MNFLIKNKNTFYEKTLYYLCSLFVVLRSLLTWKNIYSFGIIRANYRMFYTHVNKL